MITLHLELERDDNRYLDIFWTKSKNRIYQLHARKLFLDLSRDKSKRRHSLVNTL